ncbi:MAG TPA: S8 family peptidase [Pseudonocardiaceae bacterium]|nr:S8 family peptidase [Pseudonocardiaceae bacterium]
MVTQLKRHSRWLAVAAGFAAVVVGLATAAPASSAVPDGGPTTAAGSIMYAGSAKAVPGSYVVVLRDTAGTASADTITATANSLAAEYGGAVRFTYTAALKGFAATLAEPAARRLAADRRVAYVAQDQTVGLNVFVQPSPPSWGMDRVDQRSLPLDAKYHYPGTAPHIRAYIIDTGIRFTHQEFGGRAVFGTDTIGDGQNGNDCHGHGTHVAGTVGGSRVGLAKQVRLIAVRVLNCGGSGTFAQVIAGVDWVTADALVNTRPSVANMSLGGGAFQPLDDAVTNSIAANVHYSIAAGNSNADACLFSPARTPRATTLGATDITDARAGFSNFGTCVDLSAPGVAIYSAWATADNAYATLSGTSMASPHSAGTAALWRQRFPGDNADQVAAALVANATPGVITGLPPAPPTPNLLLFMGMIPM